MGRVRTARSIFAQWEPRARDLPKDTQILREQIICIVLYDFPS